MSTSTRIFMVVTLAMVFAVPAWAAPGQGIGVFGGFAQHTSSGELTEGVFDGLTFTVTSSGLSLGIDYQILLTEEFSINPFLMSSSESASSDELTIDGAGHGILGVQFRYWFGDYFAGGHLGDYSEVLSNDAGSISGRGFGFGVAGGWEREDGLFVTGQYDSAPITYSDAKSTLTGIRVNVGFRWK